MGKIFVSLIFLAPFFLSLASNCHACGHWQGDSPHTWHGYNDYGCHHMRPTVQEKYQNLPGAEIFQSKGCTSCHTIGEGDKTGPDLAGLFSRRTEDWVKNFIKDPSKTLNKNATAKELKEQYVVEMPNPELSKQELKQIMNFLKEATRQ